MNGPDFYGKKSGKIPASLIPKDVPPLNLPDKNELHPVAAQAAAVYSDALTELDQLRHSNEELRQALNLEIRLNEELSHTVDVERAQKESYMRYAIEIKTHLHNAVAIIVKARDVASAAASTESKDVFSQVEEAISEVVNGHGTT